MQLSVIIPTDGSSCDSLMRVLASIAYPRNISANDYEVIVVQDEAHERAAFTREVATMSIGAQYPKCTRWVHAGTVGNNGAAKARNEGLRIARGQRTLFIDDDCMCPGNLLALHAARGTGAALIGFRRHVRNWQSLRSDVWSAPAEHDVRWRNLSTIERDFSVNGPHLNAWAYTCHFSVSTADARAIGGFWEELKGAYEDREFALRLQRNGTRFEVLRSPMVSHLDHQQRASKRFAPADRAMFAQTVSDRSIIVRNGGPIRDPDGMAPTGPRDNRGAEPGPAGQAVL